MPDELDAIRHRYAEGFGDIEEAAEDVGTLLGIIAAHRVTMLDAINTALDVRHQPGESHRYRIACTICGQPGTIRVSVEPELVER